MRELKDQVYHRFVQACRAEAKVSDNLHDDRDRKEAATMNKIASYVSHHQLPWVITGYYILTLDSSIKHEFLGRFGQLEEDSAGKVQDLLQRLSGRTKVGIQKWNASLVGVLKGSPHGKWAKLCSRKLQQGKDEVFSQLFESMLDGCRRFEESMGELGLLTRSNYFLAELIGLCFAMLQRLMIKKPVEPANYDAQIRYTSFCNYLKSSATFLVDMQHCLDRLETCEQQQIPASAEAVIDKMMSRVAEQTKEDPDWERLRALSDDVTTLTRTAYAGKAATAECDEGSALVLLGPHVTVDWSREFGQEAHCSLDAHECSQGLPQLPPPPRDIEANESRKAHAKHRSSLTKPAPQSGKKKRIGRGKSQKANEEVVIAAAPIFKDLLGKLRGEQKDKIKQLQETGLDSVEYGAAAVRTARSEGCSVLVCLRDQSEMTADPVGFEKHLLQAPDFASGSASGFVSRIPSMNVLSAGTANFPWPGIGERASHHRLLHACLELGFMGQHRR